MAALRIEENFVRTSELALELSQVASHRYIRSPHIPFACCWHLPGAKPEESTSESAQLLTLSFRRDTWGSRLILFTAEVVVRRGRYGFCWR
jgi:hypothetical protein